MPSSTPDRCRAGQTVLVAEVGTLEPVVESWRMRFDASAAVGMPAHVTVLAPFLDIDRCTEPVLAELGAAIGAHRPFAVRFNRCGRLPDVLYLAPEPDQPFRALTSAVAARWPEAPPYGGQFAEVIPHLTVAHRQASEVFGQAETALAAQLPVEATVAAVSLFVSNGRTWQRRTEFPLKRAAQISDGR